MPCRKGCLHIVTYCIIDVAYAPELVLAGLAWSTMPISLRCPAGRGRGAHSSAQRCIWASGLRIEALRRFDEGGYS